MASLLSLYMGRVFELTQLRLYGLAFGAVMLAIVVLGFRVDYVISREIAGFPEERRGRVGATVALLFMLCFIVAAPLSLGALWYSGVPATDTFLGLLLLLCGTEAYANYLYTVTIALRRPALANALFFIRSGLWTVPAMIVSWVEPAFRSVEFILGCWLAGTTASVVVNLYVLRRQLIGPLKRGSLDWMEIRHAITAGRMIWLGSAALTLGAYVDR